MLTAICKETSCETLSYIRCNNRETQSIYLCSQVMYSL